MWLTYAYVAPTESQPFHSQVNSNMELLLPGTFSPQSFSHPGLFAAGSEFFGNFHAQMHNQKSHLF